MIPSSTFDVSGNSMSRAKGKGIYIGNRTLTVTPQSIGIKDNSRVAVGPELDIPRPQICVAQGRRRGHVRLWVREVFIIHVFELHEDEVGVRVGLVGAEGDGPGNELGDELEDAGLGVPVGPDDLGAIWPKGPLRLTRARSNQHRCYTVLAGERISRLHKPFRKSSR